MCTLDRPSVETVCPGSTAVVPVALIWDQLIDGAKTYPVMRSGALGVLGLPRVSADALCESGSHCGPCQAVLHGEFDPGSGRTLAACLTHASGATNQASAWGRAANG